MRQGRTFQHLVRSSSLAGYDQLARSVGLDPERMLRDAGIPPQYLHESSLYFPHESLFRLLNASARASGRASFGAELGHAQGPAILGPIAYLMRSSATVADAFHGLSRHFHLHNTGADVRVEVHGGVGRLCYELKVSATSSTSQAVELAIAVGNRMLRTLIGESVPVRECVFRHAPLYGLPTYRRLFGVAPRFNGEFDGYSVDARLLEQPLSSADAALHELMLQQLRESRTHKQDSLPLRVESVIRGALPHGSTALRDVAAQLATSARSLQRALQAEGVSYQQVLDKVRRDIAEHYLRESTLPLTQIAELLGYGELSNLTRAYRRWHATTPRAWRATHHNRHALPLPSAR